MTSDVFNIDCLEYMHTLPDKAFALAIADPPYGIGTGNVNAGKSTYSGAGKLRGRVLNREAGKFEGWDKAPSKKFFDELRRVSENVIIWGGELLRSPFDTLLYLLGQVSAVAELLTSRICVDIV